LIEILVHFFTYQTVEFLLSNKNYIQTPHVASNWSSTSKPSVVKTSDVRSPALMTSILSGSETQGLTKQFFGFLLLSLITVEISWNCRKGIGNFWELIM